WSCSRGSGAVHLGKIRSGVRCGSPSAPSCTAPMPTRRSAASTSGAASRTWRSAAVDEAGHPLWIRAATFDTQVGFSHTTGQITHHIGADVDSERDKVLADVRQAGQLVEVVWVDGFHERLEGKNGGDHYRTDGRLAVGILAVLGAPAGMGFPLDL